MRGATTEAGLAIRVPDVPHITARVRPTPARNVIVLTVGCR